MRLKTCAYCGKPGATDKEHVIPACLYPLSKSKSKVQRLTIPACRSCNDSWADDEAHFRNVLVLAGKPNAAVNELWQHKVEPSFEKCDGTKRFSDLLAQLKRVQTSNGEKHMIYPGRDARVLRVIRKVIRGLCYHHKVMSPVPDEQVWADVMRFRVPAAFLEQMRFGYRETDIFYCRYGVLDELEIHSVWLLTFFERTQFIGFVAPWPAMRKPGSM